jgi:DNA-binding response OmpR family regulator
MARILIIDDDESIRSMLAFLLSTAGHQVTTANDGLSGLQLFRSDPTDLVFIDMMMPHNGLSAIRVLRSQFPSLRIIAMSGGGSHRLDYARSLGAFRTLAKPFDLPELAAVVAAALADATAAPSAAPSPRASGLTCACPG